MLAAPAFAFAAALFASSAGPSAAAPAASTVPSRIGQAQRLIEEADFPGALDRIDEGLSEADTTDDWLAALHQLRAAALIYLGREEEARAALVMLLQAKPDFELSKGTGQRLRSAFADAQARIRGGVARVSRLSVDPPPAPRPGEPLRIVGRVDDLPSGARARLRWRWLPGAPFASAQFLALDEPNRYAATVPPDDAPRDVARPLAWFAEVVDAEGRRLTGVGSAFQPLELRPAAPVPERPVAATPPPPKPPAPPAAATAAPAWTSRWWVWAIAGGVVAGASAAVLLWPADRVPVTFVVKVAP